eukprot:gene271-895_t
MSKFCPSCAVDLREPFIRCNECTPRVDICPGCFAKGKEFGTHVNSHSYEVRQNNFPLFVDDWCASEELKLLDNLIDLGFGNWSAVGRQMVTKNSDACKKHYIENYIENPVEDMPVLEDRSVNENRNEHCNNSPLALKQCDDPPRPLPDTNMSIELAGYLPGRGDFNVEYDDFAETLIKDIEFDDADDELLTKLKLAAVDIFHSRLKERHRRKKLVRKYGLINLTRDANTSYGKHERTIRDSLRIFMRFQNAEDYEMFMQGILLQSNLMRQILTLQSYRGAGLKRKKDSSIYKKLMLARSETKARRNIQNELLLHVDTPISCQIWLQKQFQSNVTNKAVSAAQMFPLVSRKPVPPLDLTGTPGLEQLAEDEKDLCSQIRLLPLQYIAHKNTMRKECQRLGSLKLQHARPLIKIDVNKTKKLYDFFINKGWINNTET